MDTPSRQRPMMRDGGGGASGNYLGGGTGGYGTGFSRLSNNNSSGEDDYELSSSSISIIGDRFVMDTSTQQDQVPHQRAYENSGGGYYQQEQQQQSERQPFRVKTDQNNKKSIQFNLSTPPSAEAVNPCFPAMLSSMMPSRGVLHATQCCACLDGECTECCGPQNKTKGFVTVPSQDTNSNPVIEALGVTPKSNRRINKYSISSAMNSPGNAIPTPAPSKKRNTSKTKEKELYWMNSLKEQQQTDEDAYLPDDFDDEEGAKENQNALYTEADLKQKLEEALKIQEQKLMEAYSVENPVVRNLQQQMQMQMEQQGELWNKDLNERVENVKKNYKKRQSALKTRIQELEEQCRSMQQQKQDREEQLRKELNVLKEQSNNTGSNEVDLTQKWKELETQNSMDSATPNQDSVTSEKSELVHSLEAKIKNLQLELEKKAHEQTSHTSEQLKDMDDHLKHLRTALSEQREERKADKRKMHELEKQREILEKNIQILREQLDRTQQRDLDAIELRQSFTCRERALQQDLEDERSEAKKKQDKLQATIQSLEIELEESRKSSHSTGASSQDAELKGEIQKLSDLLEVADHSIQREKEKTQKEVMARRAMEMEVSRLAGLVQTLKQSSPSNGEIMASCSGDEEQFSISHTPSLHIMKSTSRNIDALDLKVIGGMGSRGIDNVLSSDLAGNCCGADVLLLGAQQTGLVTNASSTFHGFTTPTPTENIYLAGESMATSIRQKLDQMKDIFPLVIGSQAKDSSQEEPLPPSENVNNLNELLQTIDDQLAHFQDDLTRDAQDNDSVNRQLLEMEKGPTEPFGMQLLARQLERQRTELTRKEKEHLDEVRHAQELSQQLKDLEAKLSEHDVVEESQSSADQSVIEQLKDSLRLKFEEMAQYRSSLAQRDAEQAEAKEKIKKLQEDIALKEKDLKSKDRELEQLRLRRQTILEKDGDSYDATGTDEDAQLEEFQFMLELKQKNEQLAKELEQLKANAQDNQILGEKETQIEQDDVVRKLDSLVAHVDKAEEQHDIPNEAKKMCEGESSTMQKIEKIERHLLVTWEEFTKKKIDELTAQKEELSELKQKVEEYKKADATNEIDSLYLKKRVTDLESELQNERQALKCGSAEIDGLKQQLKEAREDSSSTAAKLADATRNLVEKQNQISSLEAEKADLVKQITILETQAEKLSREKELELEEISEVKKALDLAHQECNRVKEELENTKSGTATLKSKDSELSEVKRSLELAQQECSKVKEELKDSKTNNATLESKISELAEVKKSLDLAQNECSKVKEELKSSKSRNATLESKVSEISALLESSRNECQKLNDMLQMKSSEYEQELLARTTELEEKFRNTIANCEQQVRQVREDHAKEIDELLAQLDIIEAEEKERCNEKEILVKEKDCVISALGSQLAESQNRIASIEESLAEQQRSLRLAQEEAETAQSETGKLQAELKSLQEEHSKLREKEKAKIDKACEVAREEMIQQAEAQFEQMNGLYRTLKKEYNNATAKTRQLEEELEKSKKDLAKKQEESEAKIAALNSSLAELKTSQTNASAEAERIAKEYKSEVERLKREEQDLQSKLSDAEFSNRSVQKMLASIVAEKEKLVAENENLKELCEEAMSLAETHHS